MSTSSSPLKIEQWLKEAEKKLTEAGIGSARLDCLILLEDCLGQDRSWILANPEYFIKPELVKKLSRQLERRVRLVPLAYIRGFSEFYGRRFKVNQRVLEPRPESETLIELLLKLPVPRRAKIADVGTGSGCLGITAALELPETQVDLFDIDASALAVARHNAQMYELHLKAHKRDLLRGSHTYYDVVLANLPYIPDHWQLHPSILSEPRIAFRGGKDGLDIYRRLFVQVSGFKKSPHFVLTESLPPQHEELNRIANSAGYRLRQESDFIQVFERS